MSKTVQEIMEVMGKTAEVVMAIIKKSGGNYSLVADLAPTSINEMRYYFDGALYRSVMRCLEVKLIGNQTEKARKGYFLGEIGLTLTHPEGDSIKIKYGSFCIAEEPEYDAAQNLTSIIAYDGLYPSMQPYDISLWKQGITLKEFLVAILKQCEIPYDADSLSLMANADKVITSEKYLDIENDSTEAAYTYRDILDEIAKASGVTFAFKNSLGGNPAKLYAIKPTESGYVIDESNLRSVTIGAKYGPVKGVVLSREPQEDNVYYPSNLSDSQTAVKISNVELIEDSSNDEYRKQFAKGIYDNVTGTEYYLYDLDSFGIGFLNFGDIFTLKVCERTGGMIGDEKEYKTIFMRTDMTVSQGVKEKSKLEAPQATSTDYSAAESASDKLLKKAMIKVDKQEQRITALVKESDDKYSEFTQTINGIKGEIVDTKNDLEAKITATAEAATSQYTALKTEVKENYVANSTYNTFVNQTAEKFSTQAESIKNIQDARYITEERCNSLIEAQSDKITLSVEENLKIGARNILLNSECFAGFTPTKYKVDKVLIYPSYSDTYVPSGKYSQVIFTADSTGGDTGITRGIRFVESDILGQSTVDKVKPNTTYTLSFWLKTDSAFSHPGNLVASSAIYAGEGVKVTLDTNRSTAPTLTTSWQKYVLTFKITGSISHFYIMLFFTDCLASTQYRVDISSFKLEEGNIATDWTPSENDMVTNATYQSFINLLPDKISASVTSTVTDQYIADKINQKCVSVTLDTSGVTIENGALTLKDESGGSMIDSSGIHSEYLNFGKTIDIDTIKNGIVLNGNNVDILTLRNYTGTDTGMINAKAAVSVMLNIAPLKNLFWNNSNNWFCAKNSANQITIAEIENVEETQVYILSFDVILATTTNGKALLPQIVYLSTDKTVSYEIGVDTLTAGSAKVSEKTYQYRYGTLSCSIRGYDLIKIRGGKSQNAKLTIASIAMATFGTSNDSVSWLQALYSPTVDHMGFVGNFKLTTFVGATLNARALLNANTDYYFDLGTGILAADEISCKNLRPEALPSAQSTDDLKKVYIDPSTGQLYREL
nr:MAG TPA: S-layer associated multidomain endoglucanase 16 CBM-1 cellopentaose complex [Caudoviricetes sp.]